MMILKISMAFDLKKILVSMIAIFLLLSFCYSSGKKGIVITTVFPLTEFASAVAGSQFEVHQLIPPGAEIHAWEPRPSDVVRMSEADVFIYIGADLEPWAKKMISGTKNPSLKILEASQGLSLIEKNHKQEDHSGRSHSHEIHDPHIWLDFSYDQSILLRIASVFSEIKPEFTDDFSHNAANYIERLTELDEEYRQTLSQCENNKFFIGGHAAFGYLAKRYNLEQIALTGLHPDSSPTAKRMVEITEMARKNTVNVIFFESRESEKFAQVLAGEIQAETMLLNPGVNISLEEWENKVSFIDIMRKNLKRLISGLSCD